jgi:hypothetical protein
MDDIQKRINELERKVSLLEKRASELEQANRMHHPFQPINPPAPYTPQWVIPNACSVCGLEFKGAMGYVCTNSKCPTAIAC